MTDNPKSHEEEFLKQLTEKLIKTLEKSNKKIQNLLDDQL